MILIWPVCQKCTFMLHSNCVCICSVMSSSATPWTAACQGPLSLEFSRQEYWSGLPFPPPGDLPDPGIEPTSLVSPPLAGGCSNDFLSRLLTPQSPLLFSVSVTLANWTWPQGYWPQSSENFNKSEVFGPESMEGPGGLPSSLWGRTPGWSLSCSGELREVMMGTNPAKQSAASSRRGWGVRSQQWLPVLIFSPSPDSGKLASPSARSARPRCPPTKES